MSKPIQLIVNGVEAPTTTMDRYQCFEEPLKEVLIMADGSVTEEVVGYVWRVVYSYDKMPDAVYKALRSVITRGGIKQVSCLPDDGREELISSTFLVESYSPASLQFYLNGVPRWHNFSFALREVTPHD